MIEFFLHFYEAAEAGFKFLAVVVVREAGSVDAKEGGFFKVLDFMDGDKHAKVFVGAEDVLEEEMGGKIDPENVDGGFGKIDEEGSVVMGEVFSMGEGWGFKIDGFKTAGDPFVEEEAFEEGGREVVGEDDPFAGNVSFLHGFDNGVDGLRVGKGF